MSASLQRPDSTKASSNLAVKGRLPQEAYPERGPKLPRMSVVDTFAVSDLCARVTGLHLVFDVRDESEPDVITLLEQ